MKTPLQRGFPLMEVVSLLIAKHVRLMAAAGQFALFSHHRIGLWHRKPMLVGKCIRSLHYWLTLLLIRDPQESTSLRYFF